MKLTEPVVVKKKVELINLSNKKSRSFYDRFLLRDQYLHVFKY